MQEKQVTCFTNTYRTTYTHRPGIYLSLRGFKPNTQQRTKTRCKHASVPNNVCRVFEKFIIVDVSFVLMFLHRVYMGTVANISEVKSSYSEN
jgi:hypothetical protein